MATYGLRIINDESELLIDSEYFSPAFAQKLEFSPTVYSEEAGSTYLHSGYVKREYRTSTVTASGNFIVMWTLPNSTADVWYNFETSTTSMGGYLTLWVYANSMGVDLTYTLPTGYLFAISSLPASTDAYGLRLFNAAGTKTFDSNNVQLAPYSISDSFSFWTDPTGPQGLGTPITLDIPTNPIFMLPNYTSLRIFKKMSGQTQVGHLEFVYEAMFKREGNIVLTKEVQVYYSDEGDAPWPYTQTIYNSGNRQGLGIIVANADLYAAPGIGTGTGTNPSYQLTSTSTSTSEGTSVTVTLTTQNVANDTPFAYTVTGVAAADLSVGGTTGSFIILNNSATATFTFANDYLTEGTEIFKLSLDGMSQFINITVADTSLTPSYSWSIPGNVNEGATGFTTFNATGANGKTVIFSVTGPSAESGLTSISGSSDGSLLTGSWVVSGNAATSINVQYSAVADVTTEGPEGFRLVATVDGVQVGGTSGDITVNDTSKTAGYSLAATDNWNESNTYAVTVTANNVNGTTLYLTTDNVLVTPSSSTVIVNSSSFTTNVNFTAGITTANANVRISLRTGSASGTEVAFKQIVLTNVTPIYSFGAVSAFNEGSSGSVQFNYSYLANTTVTFEVIAPSAGLTGASDVTLNTTNHIIGATNASGNVSVTYSAAADSFTEGAEYFRINAKIGTTVIATTNNITINDTSITAATYSLTRSVASVNEGGSFTITFATNQAGSFAYTITGVSSADIGGASLTGNVSNGSVLSYTATADATTEGSETFSITLNNGLSNTPTVTINDTSITAATYSLTRSVASVNEGGSFTITFATNQAGSFAYTITGVSSADIGGASLTGNVSNGSVLSYTATADATTEGSETFSITLNNGLSNTPTVTINDTSKTPPGYSIGNIWTTLANGFSANFYLNSTNANGVTVTVSKSGTGASRVTINPTSFTINSDASTNTYVGVTASFPTTTVAQQDVTISLSTGQSFLFSIPAYTVAGPAPTITSVVMQNGEYYPGETVDAIIYFDGPITSDTYVNTKLTAGAYGSFYITSTTGAAVSPGANGTGGEYIDLVIGASSAYYTGPTNPGQLNVLNATLSARTMTGTATGVQRQAYIVTPTFKIYT